jgi:hypothetical protein
MDDTEYTPRKGRDKLDGPAIPFTSFAIEDADTYGRAVLEAYQLKKNERGEWRTPFTYTPVIKPIFEGKRCFQLEAWVEYFLARGMKNRAVLDVRHVWKERRETAVPAEFPWLFDPRWSIRATVPPVPAEVRRLAGMDIPSSEAIRVGAVSTEGFTRYRSPEGREAFRWAVFNLPPEPGHKTASLADCFAYADPIEATARSAA